MYSANYYQPTQKPLPPPTKKRSRLSMRARLLTAALLTVIVAFPSLSYAASHRSSAINEIKSSKAGYCLDLHHDSSVSGTEVDDWSCNGTDAQAWDASNSVISHATKTCLTISGDGQTSGDKIVSDPCNGNSNQVWISAIGGYENPASALCLAIPNSSARVQLQAQSCGALTTTSELWQPAVWKADDTTPASLSCSTGTEGQKIACVAAQQWAIWNAPGANHGNLLNQYSDGNGYEEWCADFVSWVYQQAGYPFSNGERNNWDEYLATNLVNQGLTYHDAANYTPQTGDVAFFNYNGGHVEIVAIGGAKPVFIYGDSGTTDPQTGNGNMAENSITNDGNAGAVQYYLSLN